MEDEDTSDGPSHEIAGRKSTGVLCYVVICCQSMQMQPHNSIWQLLKPMFVTIKALQECLLCLPSQ